MKKKIISRSINMPELRRRLFGKDRLPVVPWPVYYPKTPLMNHNSEDCPEAILNLILLPQKEVLVHNPDNSFSRRVLHRSAHRLVAVCTCGREIPVGRLAQHTH